MNEPDSPAPAPGELTLLLQRIEQGDAGAAARLVPLVCDDLRRLAAAKLAREKAAHTLQPTALVHEVWLRLGGDRPPTWRNRAHFFGAALAVAGPMERDALLQRARVGDRARYERLAGAWCGITMRSVTALTSDCPGLPA